MIEDEFDFPERDEVETFENTAEAVLTELFEILEVPENASITDKAREVMEVYCQARGF